MNCKLVAGLTTALFLVSVLSMVGLVSAPVTGDINGDTKVDISDIVQWSLAFGSTPTSSNWDPAADINGDNIVNIKDGVVIATHFGEVDP